MANRKWKLALKVIPIIILVAVLKFAAHSFQAEFLNLSALFTALISANIFLVGFIVSGVLSDYKEGEKLPGEMASSIDAIADEFVYTYKGKKAEPGKAGFSYCIEFTGKLLDWFGKKTRTREIMENVAQFSDRFLAIEPSSQPAFISRMKQEQTAIRKTILRIHTIRETSFSEAAYAIVEIITLLLVAGMVFLKLDPYFESLFFVVFVTFILVYMQLLIRDLDNPFDYCSKDSAQEVSLQPLENLKLRLEARSKELI